MKVPSHLAWFTICGAGVWLLVTAAGAQSQSAKVQQMADLVVSAYNDGNYEAIIRQLNSAAQARVTGEELRRFYDGLHASAGNITSLGKPAFFDDAIGILPATFEQRNCSSRSMTQDEFAASRLTTES